MKLLGEIPLVQVTAVRRADKQTGKKNSLSIEVPGRSYQVYADTVEDGDAWFELISDTKQALKPKLTMDNRPPEVPTVSRDQPPAPEAALKTGYLMKAAKKGPKGGFRRRFFVLGRQDLTYYLDYLGWSVSHAPLGRIPLRDILSIETADSESGKNYSLKILTTYRTYYVFADRQEIKADWCKVLSTVVDKDGVREQLRRLSEEPAEAASAAEVEGFLGKRRHKAALTHTRWCVVRDSLFLYFESPQDTKPLGVLPLTECEGVELFENDPLTFRITAAQKQFYIFTCITSQDCQRWMTCLSKKIPNKRATQALSLDAVSFDQPLSQGWLFKKGKRSWKRRWVVLSTNGVLTYFESEKDVPTRPLGFIPLAVCTKLEIAEKEPGKQYTWILESSVKKYLFCSSSVEDRVKWMDNIMSLNKAIQRLDVPSDAVYAEHLQRAFLADLSDFYAANPIKQPGVDKQGRTIVQLVFDESNTPIKAADMERLFLFAIKTLHEICKRDYVVVFLATAQASVRMKLSHIWKLYGILSRDFKKNIKAFYIVQQSLWSPPALLASSLTALLGSGRSEKARTKCVIVPTLAKLSDFISPENLFVPANLDEYQMATAVRAKPEGSMPVRATPIKRFTQKFFAAPVELPLELRAAKLKEMLRSCPQHRDDIGFHAYDDSQADFWNLFTAQSAEGRKIQSLCEILRNETTEPKENKIVAEDIVNFVEDFSVSLMSTYEIESDELSKLRLCTARYIFPQIADFVFSPLFEAHGEKEQDDELKAQVQWLRKLSPRELGISPKYCNPLTGEEMTSAISILEELALHTVPVDMLYCVMSTARTINFNAVAYATQQAKAAGRESVITLGADDFFPLLLFVVIRADLPTVHQCIGFMRRFAPMHARFSELDYCLTSLEAAVVHIRQLTPEAFALP
eukprot:TRINITY_DN2745_c0_g1_i1.p1 TRINITY_DN2745_c0_g1~~TRINITY_DN2745_c0_g1_i1.p1  ORF type:complete len:969 (+),score=230.79 TRINITY_DN2745_c0_g1_i1:167-2908(+)